MDDFSKNADRIFDNLKAKQASKVIVISSPKDKEKAQHIVDNADTQGIEVIVLTKEEAVEQGFNVDELKEAHVAVQEFNLKQSLAKILSALDKHYYDNVIVRSEREVGRGYQREQMKYRNRFLNNKFRK